VRVPRSQLRQPILWRIDSCVRSRRVTLCEICTRLAHLTFLPVFGWLGSRSSLGSIASAIYVIHVAAYPDRRKQLMSDKLTNARAEKRKDPPTPKKPPIKEPKKKEKPVGDPPSQRRPIRSVRREFDVSNQV
jgi:hypothetical protein